MGDPLTVTVIATFLDEAASMTAFLSSLDAQTRPPDDVILVDGGSSDGSDVMAAAHPRVRLMRVPGNRSVGRNAALEVVTTDLVAATDLGCTLEPEWLARLVAPFEEQSDLDVAMGWWVPPAGNERVRAAVAVLTVPISEVDAATTRPSTRSVAFRPNRVVPFPVQFGHNEDAVWFEELRRRGRHFVFVPEARVVWTAPSSGRQLFRVVERYGRGDGDAGLDPLSYAKVASQLAALTILATASTRSVPARLVLAAGLASYCRRMAARASTTLEHPSFLQAWLRVPAYGLVVKAAQVTGYSRGLLERSVTSPAVSRWRDSHCKGTSAAP